ncbi:NAD(P)/FAD-dependent oxidoreductase [Chamaesiphon sp.]|uniref:NAD(P)/FAD-dependent oxidoreductase n=1 Tax=Chamaesiphon sp. TaxID=2814140 RepID=UPI003593DCE2
MQELLYIEIPTPNIDRVRSWLQSEWQPESGVSVLTTDGLRVQFPDLMSTGMELVPELSVFVWSLQRTTYLKVFRWAERVIPPEGQIVRELTTQIRQEFPATYPAPPEIDLSNMSIFEALEPFYPATVKYFRKMPKGEADLQRVYWWEQRWREGVRNPQQPKQVLFRVEDAADLTATLTDRSRYDLIYIGGALGVIHAAVMARLGYRVLLLERLPFGRMNREWNISREEFQRLIDLNLFTPAEFEGVIAREYVDGFSKFFDANNPASCQAKVLSTPTVLNICLDGEALLRICGDKLRQAGGEIWDETEFSRADISERETVVTSQHLPTGERRIVRGRLLVDAMGTASPIAWQLNGTHAFDSVCPTVGAAIASGFAPEVWDARYGDVLFSHGDISRGRQLIWELFPGAGEEIVVYLFHYHQVNPENPGSLLEMYEDFFTILPEYRRCDMDELVWRKPTFGYIPGHFTVSSRDRVVAFDRTIAIGDAASLQSPLVFTGFGSLVRNLPRLTHLLDTALKHDLLDRDALDRIRAYQSNVAVTWLFSKGMMVPTGMQLPPERINATLNTFFGLLANEPPEVADTFIKDRTDWLTFNRLALKAAGQNPALLWWIWKIAGAKDIFRWLGSYLIFGWDAIVNFLFSSWIPAVAIQVQPWLEARSPRLWLRLLAFSYTLKAGKQPPLPPPNPKVNTDSLTVSN